MQVIEIIGKENVKLSSKQIDELIELIDKEGILEVEDKIEKALQKDKAAKEEKKKLDREKETKDVSANSSSTKAEPPKSTKTESTQTIVTPPPSIDKSKDSSKML